MTNPFAPPPTPAAGPRAATAGAARNAGRTDPFGPPPPPPPPRGVPDEWAAWRPQPSLPAAVRAAYVRARFEWQYALYDGPLTRCGRRDFHAMAKHSARESLRPLLPVRLVEPLAELVAALACPAALRWPRLFRHHSWDDGAG